MKTWKECHFNGIDSQANYSGEVFENYFVLYVYTELDGNILNRSNYEAICENLQKELGNQSENSWFVNIFGHWTYSYYNEILINKDNKEAVEIAENIENILSDYFIFDEDRYSKLQWEDMEKTIEKFFERSFINHINSVCGTDFFDINDIDFLRSAVNEHIQDHGLLNYSDTESYIDEEKFFETFNLSDYDFEEEIEQKIIDIVKPIKKPEFGNIEHIKIIDKAKELYKLIA